MKKIFLFSLAVMLWQGSIAQKTFYVIPSVGYGFTHSGVFPESYSNAADHTVATKSLLRYSGKVYAGYIFDHFRIQAGLLLFSTGFRLTHSRTGEYYRTTYNHVGLGFQVGHNLLSHKKLGIIPLFGALTTYNFNGGTHSQTGKEFVDENYRDRYHKVSVWGTLALQIEYKLNDRFRLSAGPSAQYTINKFQKQSEPHNLARYSRRNSMLDFNLGLLVSM